MQATDTIPRRFSTLFVRFIGFALAFVFTGLAMADPPMRVARLGYLSGSVSFSPAGENEWVGGALNRPLVTGDRLWADGESRVELQMGAAVVRLDARTLFTLTNLDDRIAQMNLQDGTLNLRVRRLDRGQVVEVDTPNLAFVIRQPGEYRITVEAARDSTEVRTRSGRADVYATGARYAAATGSAYRFFGAGLADYDVLSMPRADEFDRWAQARDRSFDTSISARYVSRDVIGYQDLDQYGSWRTVAQYGNVWTPSRVAANWAPYRDGHWSWVEPWGWTWVDDLPWGFAVSHYGRWINSDGRWGWIPGPTTARAVYAPALVAFVGGSNFQAAASAGNGGAVGWFPLGPREVYRPAYAVSREYFTNVNNSNTTINNTTIINYYDNRNAANVTNGDYANRRVPGAVVTVPTAAFVQSQPVSRAALRVPEAAIIGASITTLATVAPTQISVLGAATQRAMPPQRVQQRVVAQSPPPATAIRFAVRERALAANPGKPVDTAALATIKPAVPPTRDGAGAPVAPTAAPRIELVPESRAAGPAAVAPPPRAPSDRRGKGEPLRDVPPVAQPPLTAGVTPAPPVARPLLPAAPQEAPKPAMKPAEPSGRPIAAPPVVPVPAAAPPALGNAGNKPRDQRDPPAGSPPVPALPPATVRPTPPAPPAQPQSVPAPASAQSGARGPSPVPPEVPKPGNKPPEPAGRPAAAATPTPQTAPGAAPPAPAPTNPGRKPREQREAPVVVPPVVAAPPVQVQQPARPPQPKTPPVAEPGTSARAPAQTQRVRPEPPTPANPGPAAVPAAQPPDAAKPGNAPPQAAKGNKKPAVIEDKKDGKPEKDDDEKKRK